MQDNSTISSTVNNNSEASGSDSEHIITRNNQSYLAFDTGTTRSDKKLTKELLTKYREEVYRVRPNFKDIIGESGDIPIYDYLRRQVRENRNKIIKERREEFIATVGKETKRLLGSEIADGVKKQLKGNSYVSTIQHSAPLSHPYVLSSTIQNSLSSFGNNHPNLKNTIVLSCANISFNNFEYPRGNLFHSLNNGINIHQLPLFGRTSDSRPVIHHSPYSFLAVEEIKRKVLSMKKNNEITNEQADNLINFIEEIYASPHSLSQRNFHDQLTVTNYYFFKKLFSNYSKSVPNLIFLSQEMVVMKLIKNHHLYNSTLINQMLFDPSTIELIKKYYEGLNGAFSFKNKTGTFLFWGLPKKSKNRMQLWHKNNCLVSNDESFKVELTPDAINESLIKRELIPNTHLNYTMLAFYYGQYLAGGPAQTKNIASMRDAFTKMVTEAGNTEALEALEGLQTKNLVLSRPTLAYIDNPKQDQRIPATGLDMILYGDKGTSWDSIISATKNTTLSEFFDRGLVSFYQEFVPNDRKTDEMSKITERDIEVLTGLDKKIPALINV